MLRPQSVRKSQVKISVDEFLQQQNQGEEVGSVVQVDERSQDTGDGPQPQRHTVQLTQEQQDKIVIESAVDFTSGVFQNNLQSRVGEVEVMCAVVDNFLQGEINRVLVLEGERGTGKNTIVSQTIDRFSTSESDVHRSIIWLEGQSTIGHLAQNKPPLAAYHSVFETLIFNTEFKVKKKQPNTNRVEEEQAGPEGDTVVHLDLEHDTGIELVEDQGADDALLEFRDDMDEVIGEEWSMDSPINRRMEGGERFHVSSYADEAILFSSLETEDYLSQAEIQGQLESFRRQQGKEKELPMISENLQ
eukprot:TRINITY_DN2205_c0_g1_i1.p1 TRINITY_DN2205_c0_g1~~TRINITY_DN2205_c0_g1_i1.p1  ORF type:complete len:303 (-),score=102.59 TRINITY_DN2205_c0_g1_i1:180-1088(-)